ncbi:MAG: AAA-like domain-containing protein [Desulfovibrio sp.]|nr:AAA-like domain-containing protein [Desulfovibrio sp.]
MATLHAEKSLEFNISGPCFPDEHYMLGALNRLPNAKQLSNTGKYFVIHAPRQSGKTTALLSLTDEINNESRYHAVYCTLEMVPNNAELCIGVSSIVTEIVIKISNELPGFSEKINNIVIHADPTHAIYKLLSDVSALLDRPLILFFDEADCLSGGLMINFLHQLRAGYNSRKKAPFPHSVALVGMRNIHDYKIFIRGQEESLGTASPFNIIDKTLTLRNFTYDEVRELYMQHTELTRQIFNDDAIRQAFYWTDGQPWLTNAIPRQIIEEDLEYDYSIPITSAHVDAAVDAMSKRPDAHMLSIFKRLEEERVQRIIEPMLVGDALNQNLLGDDARYCIDIGLVKINDDRNLLPANPLYCDLIVRYLTYTHQNDLPVSLKNRWMNDETIDMTALLKEFQKFWRENSEIWKDKFKTKYSHAAAQLLLHTFLQRVTNGGAKIHREFALGSYRADICITYKDKNYPIEIKMESPMALGDAIPQLARYMDHCGANQGWLVVFATSLKKAWKDKIYWRQQELDNGGCIHIVGC